MENPNYILKANEGVFTVKNTKTKREKLKRAAQIIAGIFIIVILLLYGQIWAVLLLFTSGIATGAVIRHKKGTPYILQILRGVRAPGKPLLGDSPITSPSPFELWFFDDHLIIYREKLYCNRKLSRKKYDKLLYKDIRQCEYRMISGRIIFFGIVESIWYDYNEDGSLPQRPTYHKTTDSNSYFYTTEEPSIDFVAEIEDHSPIHVVMLDK